MLSPSFLWDGITNHAVTSIVGNCSGAEIVILRFRYEQHILTTDVLKYLKEI